MQTLTAAEAAELLHLNVKRIQSLARAGKLPAVRVGRKWLFPRDRIEQLLASEQRAERRVASLPRLEISARNRLRGRIEHVERDGLMAEVHVAIGDQRLTAVITRTAADTLNLKVGDLVLAVIKSTEVMIGKEGDL